MGLSPAERQARYKAKRYAEIEAMPKIPCGCGCGILIAPITRKLRPALYVHGHNPGSEETRFPPGHDGTAGVEARKQQGKDRGPGHVRWKGGENPQTGGYVRVTLTPEEGQRFPTARRYGNHWNIGRSHAVWNRHHPDDMVQPGEQVHHRNRVRDDDRIENLEKLSAEDHMRLHRSRD